MRDPQILHQEYPYSFTLSLDDSDTPWGGCTTQLATILLTGPLQGKVILADYPLLVRLNPTVPRKTRGNAAVVLRGYSRVPPGELAETAAEAQWSYVEERPPGKLPGIAVYPGADPWRDPRLRYLYKRALADYVPASMARRLAVKAGAQLAGGSGVVGAAASLAALAPWDPYTYELIAYRAPENMGKPRCVRRDPRLEKTVPPCGNANTDLYNGVVAAAPGGPDPVLAGFRGTLPWCLSQYAELLCEEPWAWTLYRSNQHTGIHTRAASGPPRPYKIVRVKGRVRGTPRLLPKGHVLVDLETPWGTLTAAFYRETGPLRDAARLLGEGDLVEVEAGVVPRLEGPTLAAEALTVYEVAERILRVAPRCPRCGARMESMGKGKGYRCPRCGLRDPRASPLQLRVPRPLRPGRYTGSVSGARHLTRLSWLEPGSGDPRVSGPVECFSRRGRDPPPLSTPSPNC